MTRVKVKQGEIEGALCYYEDGNYLAFKGIPYAKPPLANLRFKAPQPPDCWQGVRDAKQHGPVCPQYNVRLSRLESGSEDCLYLNVYTKTLTPPQPAPVMVWIHGGAFYTGSGNSDFYGPEFIVNQDTVLVTFNYRLEVLGFLCLDTEEVPGNAGLKDQVAALKWVKDNISAFGGDSNNITIFGCSAGSSAVSYHLISNMSEGLYNKAICQSGVCLNEWSYGLYPRERAKQLGKLLGTNTDNIDELLAYLREVPVMSLVNISLPHLDVEVKDLCDSILFGPVIEKSTLNVDKFITESPPNLLCKGKLAKIPIMLGYTSGEGIEIVKDHPDNIKHALSCVEYYVPRELKLQWPSEKVLQIGEIIMRQHFKEEENNNLQHVVDFITDLMFVYNIRRFGRFASRLTNSPVFMYKFDIETERNYTKKHYKMESLNGVCHTDDLPYLFNITCLDISMNKESKNIIDKIVTLWTQFARTGNPNYTNELEQWHEFTENEQHCYVIGHTFKCIQQPNAERMKFWDNIYGIIQVPLNQS